MVKYTFMNTYWFKGDSITISVVLVSLEDGQKIIETLNDTDPMIADTVALKL